MKSLAIIGFGNMGEALIAGIRKKCEETQQPQHALYVIEKDDLRRKHAREHYGAIDLEEAGSSAGTMDMIILAIKPQDIPAVADAHTPLFRKTPVISIAAGMSLARLAELFPSSPLIRFMPSLAAKAGKAVTAVAFSKSCTESVREHARALADDVGISLELPEKLFPAIIGISGSAIAYVYEFIHALALGGVKEGVKYEESLAAVLNVLEGAATTVRQAQADNLSPSDLVTRVCSPGGTTIEGMKILHDNRFTAVVMEAVSAAAGRARELEQSSE